MPSRRYVGVRTKELTEEICGYIREGAPLKVAAVLAGISERTLHRWRELGKIEEREAIERAGPDGDPGEPPDGSAWQFSHLIARARYEHHQALVADLKAQSFKGDSRATTWWLMQMFPEFYRDKKRVEVTGADGGPLQVRHDLLDMSPEQLAALASEEEEEDS